MAVSYKNETPVFKSKFLNFAQQNENSNIHFLGNFVNGGKIESDLYLILNEDVDKIGVAVQYGDEEHEYDSGIFGVWIDYLDGKKTAHNEIYLRAVELGLFVEKTAYIGYSETYRDLVDEEYYKSDYYKNLPKRDEYVKHRDEYEYIDQLDFDNDRFEQDLRSYQFSYLEANGELPKQPGYYSYHLFENEAQAEEMCKNKMGVFEKVRYINTEHLYYIDKKNGYMAQQLNNSIERMKLEKEQKQ